jgi:hypothetical protein
LWKSNATGCGMMTAPNDSSDIKASPQAQSDWGLFTTCAVTSQGLRAEPKSGMCCSNTARTASLG